MSQIELYQSVLSNLGRLPAQELATLDAYLTRLVKRASPRKNTKGIAHLAGAWKDWNDADFEDFLKTTHETRHQ